MGSEKLSASRGLEKRGVGKQLRKRRKEIMTNKHNAGRTRPSSESQAIANNRDDATFMVPINAVIPQRPSYRGKPYDGTPSCRNGNLSPLAGDGAISKASRPTRQRKT